MTTPRWTSLGATLLVTLAACAIVYGAGLGNGGFAGTEGHRAAPAYGMLETGEVLIPTMFGQDYLRKPPGMPWAIAVSSAVLGRTEFAARLVSALSAAGVAVAGALSARRWFGPRAGVPAGLTAALLPAVWAFARAAEIEALNHLGVTLAALTLVDMVLLPGRGHALRPVLLALGTAVMLFAKGPAGAVVVAAAAIAAVWQARTPRPVFRPAVLIPVALALGVFAAWMLAAARFSSPTAVTQSPDAFLWTEPPLDIALFPLLAFFGALPASLAVTFPWGRDAAQEPDPQADLPVARTLAAAYLLSIAVWTLAGVGNPRYALPAAVLLPPLVGHVFARHAAGMTPARTRIFTLLRLGPAWVMPAALTLGWLVYLRTVEGPWRASSGREAGAALAAALPGAEVVAGGSAEAATLTLAADGVIEARPEVLLALAAAYGEGRGSGPSAAGPGLILRWQPGLHTGETDADLVLLRADALGDETAAFSSWTTLATADVHKYSIRLALRPRR